MHIIKRKKMYTKILISVLSTLAICLISFFIYLKYSSSIHAIGEVESIKWGCASSVKSTETVCTPTMVGKVMIMNCNPQTNYTLVNSNYGDGVNYQCIAEGADSFHVTYYVWFKVFNYKAVQYETTSRDEILKINSKNSWLLHMNNNFEIRRIE